MRKLLRVNKPNSSLVYYLSLYIRLEIIYIRTISKGLSSILLHILRSKGSFKGCNSLLLKV